MPDEAIPQTVPPQWLSELQSWLDQQIQGRDAAIAKLQGKQAEQAATSEILRTAIEAVRGQVVALQERVGELQDGSGGTAPGGPTAAFLLDLDGVPEDLKAQIIDLARQRLEQAGS